MSDANSLLLDALRHHPGQCLLVADENCLDFPFRLLPATTSVISNRLDIAQQAQAAGINSQFCDFDFSAIGDHSLAAIVYRLSKEKAVVHHIANQAKRVLSVGGELILVGGKQEGIKTFAKTIGQLLAGHVTSEKHGNLYRVRLTNGDGATPPLDDRHYRELREIFTLNGLPVVSKPGLFGWDKIDQGSQLLADYLPEFIQSFSPAQNRLLDLGCGYGYLSLAASGLGDFRITATDNCAAAIAACRANFSRHHLHGEVVADNCGETLPPGFDIILCNPPFHQGFENDRRLTEKFLGNCHRLLKHHGRALFVVNGFIPLETLAQPFFTSIAVPLYNGRFKLVTLGKL